MDKVFDEGGILSAQTFRESGEGHEVHAAIRAKHGFMCPVFLTNRLVNELVPDIPTHKNKVTSFTQNQSHVLQILKANTQECSDPNVIFDAVVPIWSAVENQVVAKDLKLIATITIGNDSPYVIVAEYDEVKDMFE